MQDFHKLIIFQQQAPIFTILMSQYLDQLNSTRHSNFTQTNNIGMDDLPQGQLKETIYAAFNAIKAQLNPPNLANFFGFTNCAINQWWTETNNQVPISQPVLHISPPHQRYQQKEAHKEANDLLPGFGGSSHIRPLDKFEVVHHSKIHLPGKKIQVINEILTKKNEVRKAVCTLHPSQELLPFVCIECNRDLLCNLCMKSKIHFQHNVRTIRQDIPIIKKLIYIRANLESVKKYKDNIAIKKNRIQFQYEQTLKELDYNFKILSNLLEAKKQMAFNSFMLFYQDEINKIQLEEIRIDTHLGSPDQILVILKNIEQKTGDSVTLFQNMVRILNEMNRFQPNQMKLRSCLFQKVLLALHDVQVTLKKADITCSSFVKGKIMNIIHKKRENNRMSKSN